MAAIVFTDAAGFTSRMQAQAAETNVLKILENDFAKMREIAQELSGTVLKSTGDGLLLYFTSAVQAMTWALRAQQHFAEQAKTKSEGEFLRHRVGVHVGDVFVRANDVMGDGVNFAARVQAEAPNGGICISQVAYDLVKSRMELHVVRLEPRKLKNISGVVQMYHVLLEAPVRPASNTSTNSPLLAPREDEKAKAPGKTARNLILTLLAVTALGAGTFLILRWQQMVHEKELASSQTLKAAFTAAVARHGDVTDASGKLDFAKMASPRQPSENDSPAVRSANDALKPLYDWLGPELRNYTRDRPMLVRALRGGPDQTFYTAPEGKLSFGSGGASHLRDWAELPPEQQAAIIVSVLRNAPKPTAEWVRGAEAFAYLHGLPEMAEVAVRELRPKAGAAP